MADKNSLTERERRRGRENSPQKERELIEKMRRRAALAEDREQMAEATGVADYEVLEALQELGYTAMTIRLMPIVPLVQVAWAEGGVTPKERKLLLEIAEAREILPSTPAHDQLLEWLEHEPPQEFYDDTLHGLHLLLHAIPDDLREASRESLVEYCMQIAEVSGGILGFGRVSSDERELIARIATEIGESREAAVKSLIDE
ncbi:MAG: TerB family tellurite resistance protein [Blastocatellia bacterium]|nr:TerB family tellurite resistance protein [Blastocatellia bacterium]